MSYEMSARFPGLGAEGDGVCCFGPRLVLSRMRDEFGEDLEIEVRDLAWKDRDLFLEMAKHAEPGRYESPIAGGPSDGSPV